MALRCSSCGAPIAERGRECVYCGGAAAEEDAGGGGVFEDEMRREARLRYRVCVVRALDNDGVIDANERAFLEDIRAASGLEPEEAAEVEREAFAERTGAEAAGWWAGADPYTYHESAPQTYAPPQGPQPAYGVPYCPHCSNIISDSNLLHRCRLCQREFCDRCPPGFTLPVRFKSYRIGWSDQRDLVKEGSEGGSIVTSPLQVLKHAWVDIDPHLCDGCYEGDLGMALRALKSEVRAALEEADEETVVLKREGASEVSRVSRLVPDNLFLHEATGMIIAALEGCSGCRGAGWCAACGGEGICSGCRGEGTCPSCRGSRTGSPDPGCVQCHGSGRCPMPRCEEGVCGYCHGVKRCATCEGSGETYTAWSGELARRLQALFEEITAASCVRCHRRLVAVAERDRWYCPGCETYV